MGKVDYVKLEKITLKNHPQLNEKWVQQVVADDPSILGLGDLVLKDKERIQPRAGRLDLLLQEPDSGRRYEVEVQLGKTDESHIVRTLEYWDIERKRYPQYDHTAVIVAEDITSRFLNVISLFNGFIPLVAIQMNAVRTDGKIALFCTTVLDQMTLGMEEEEEEQEPTDRSYWEKRATPATVAMVDQLLKVVHSLDPAFELNYTKSYIGLAKEGQSKGFVTFRPRKSILRLAVRMEKSDELEEKLSEAGLDIVEYTKRGRYLFSLTKGDVKEKEAGLTVLLQRAYEEMEG